MIIRLDSTTSTNSELAVRAAELPHGATIVAREQTAGRGQRGNGWEAEPGKNLTFSILLRPRNVRAAEAFSLSMLTSLAIAGALEELLPETRIYVKWPNDIYVGDLKICGILHENSISGGRLDYSVAGIGINVNQLKFLSNAPNPVSMAILAGREFDLSEVLDIVRSKILQAVDLFDGDTQALASRYRRRLWRGEGQHHWHDNVRNEEVTAAIADVAPDGTLTLDTRPPRTFLFKELSPVHRHRYGGEIIEK